MSGPRGRLSALQRWYERSGRELPWRGERDPYRVWLREIMLQQTTVTAVVPYFQRFITAFPTVQSLAAADEMAVLRLWEGLGYYSRARNLHRAARQIVSELSEQFPSDAVALEALPGVGRYTAGAIASFAFDQRAAIIEANTLRLHARLIGYVGDPRSKDGQAELWSSAAEFVNAATPEFGPGAINQALMDLGATVCTPQSPRCPECPLQKWCVAFQAGQQNEIPRPVVRPVITEVTEATVAIHRRGEFLLRQRAPGERWAGLWDFPRYPVDDDAGVVGTIADGVRAQTGLTIALGDEIATFKHGVTRYRITLRCFAASVEKGRLHRDDSLRWVAPRDFPQFPLSVTGRKFAQRLTNPGLFDRLL
ncbi:MAG TPA: A/G-specific adenine glycosylase [Planctomycetaceae bacterium]|nr:A/G-specific adenine glycosylase [Planctomycetaceae bacterium]